MFETLETFLMTGIAQAQQHQWENISVILLKFQQLFYNFCNFPKMQRT